MHPVARNRGLGGWEDFDIGFPVVPDNWSLNGDDDYTITTTSAGPRLRTAEEVAAAIKAAGGKLVVGANSSELIIALNNQLRFSVRQVAGAYSGSGARYEIQDRLGAAGGSQTLLLAGLGLALVMVVVMKK